MSFAHIFACLVLMHKEMYCIVYPTKINNCIKTIAANLTRVI